MRKIVKRIRGDTGSKCLRDETFVEGRMEEAVMQLSAVIERIDEGITLSDSKGSFVIFNSKMEDITGYKMDEANSHKDFMSLLYADPEERHKAFERLGEVVSKGRVYEAESTITSKEGEAKTLLISTSLIQHMGQEMFLSVYRDISKHKKFDQLKDDFINMVSHELRTPLSIINEGINIMLDQLLGAINEEQAKILKSAKSNVERLKRILNNILDISKIESGKTEMHKETVNIAELMKDVFMSFEHKMKDKGIEARVDLPKCKINIFADKDILTQIMTNLIDNAVKFTERGYVRISAREIEEGVECSVMDTGIGIADKNLPKVFGKFQQFGRMSGSGERGTGLGLVITKKLVNMHCGNILVESRLGKGTKVIFTLPKDANPGGCDNA